MSSNQLEIIRPDGKLEFYDLDSTRDVINIGRHPENDIVLDNLRVAPFHAILYHTQEPYHFVCLDRMGETTLSGQPLSPDVPAEFRIGDALELGGYTIILLASEGIAGEPEPVAMPVSQEDLGRISPPSISIQELDTPQERYSNGCDFTIGELSPRQQSLPWFKSSARVTISVVNKGDSEIPLHLEGKDTGGECNFEFQSPENGVSLARQIELRLLPNKSISIPIQVIPPPRQLIGLVQRTYHFTITVTVLNGRRTSRSVLGQVRSSPLAGPGLLAILIVCLVAAFMFIYNSIPNMTTRPVMAISQEIGFDSRDYSLFSVPVEIRPETPVIIEVDDNGKITYEEMFQEIAAQYGFDWQLLARQAYQESRLNPLAIGKDNDMGLMQIIPSTWSEWAPKVGVSDPFDPYSNVLVAVTYLAFLRDHFGDKGYPEDYWMLVAYNWGPKNLNQLLAEDGDWADVPERQRRYVLSILQASSMVPPSWEEIREELVVRTPIYP